MKVGRIIWTVWITLILGAAASVAAKAIYDKRPKPLPHFAFEPPIEEQIEAQVAAAMAGIDPALPIPIIVNGKAIRHIQYGEIKDVLLGEGFEETETKWSEPDTYLGCEPFVESASFQTPDKSLLVVWFGNSGCYTGSTLTILATDKRVVYGEKLDLSVRVFLGSELIALGDRFTNTLKGAHNGNSWLLRGGYEYNWKINSNGDIVEFTIYLDNWLDSRYLRTEEYSEERCHELLNYKYRIEENKRIGYRLTG